MVRIKNRYLLFNILYPSTTPESTNTSTQAKTLSQLTFQSPTPAHITPQLLLSHIRSHIAVHFGDTGLGLTTSRLKIIYFSPTTSTVILRCPRAHVKVVWAALTYMVVLPGRTRGEQGPSCVLRVVRVSGTIRKSEEEIIRRARREIVRAKGMEGDVLGRLLCEKGAAGGGAEDMDIGSEMDVGEGQDSDSEAL
jgi:ribonuclease P/MRP protein subunit POP5